MLVRADLNVPVDGAGKVSDITRLERLLPTLEMLTAQDAKVGILSHFGRPKGMPQPAMSLRPVAAALAELVGAPVAFAEDCIGEEAARAMTNLAEGTLLVLENTRFHPGEAANDPDFAAALAENGDIYVNDAFSAAHRAHASTVAIAGLLPAYAGRAMEAELATLGKVLENPERPVMALVGGAKIATKLDLLSNLVGRVETLFIGGGMANTFLAAKGIKVGASLCEHDLANTAQAIMDEAKARGCALLLPTDAVIATEFKPHAPSRTVAIDVVPEEGMILDVGPDTLATLAGYFETTKTIVWNGPLGAFEVAPFNIGTDTAARHVGMLTKMGMVTSVAGGGDTVAALNGAGATHDFTYVSTAGGAFLEWLEGKTLPGVAVLEEV